MLEGWMLGFSPVGDEAAAAFDPHLAAVNRELRRGGYDRLHLAVDDWVVVRVEHIEWVREWRLEAEREARAAGRGALTDDEVADFVDRFLPAYRAYLPGLYGDGPFGSQTGKVLTVRVDRGRNVLDV
jgi:D-glycerate 3-kinase